MKKFTTKLSLFVFFFLAVIISTTFVVRKFSTIEIDKSESIVVIGHSHPEVAFNDELIGGLVNFSSSGESYFYNYFKLKILLENNPHIQTVFIELTNNQIGIYNDNWIWGAEKMLHFFPKYAVYMDTESLKFLYSKNPIVFENFLFPVIKNNFQTIVKGLDISYLGGYKILDKKYADVVEEDIVTSNKEIPVNLNVSIDNLEYLQKIVDLCKSRNKEIYFIRSPLHKEYSGFDNEESFKEIIKEYFPTTEFLDFSNFPLEDSSYGDLEHLNHEGARIFSTWIAGLLDNGFISSNSKKEIIKTEIKSISQNNSILH